MNDHLLARVREYRRAARAIVETDQADIGRRCLGLLDLVDMARAEADLTTRTWAERAVWEESRPFLDMDDDPPALPPEAYEHRAKRLRADGLETCPTCLGTIATDEEIRRWAQLRRDEIKRLRVREQANR